jgi:hypothetical protein
MSFWFVDPAKAAQLNLRSGVAPAPVLAVLPANAVVEKLGAVASDPNWWQVRATLSGANVVGFAHSAYLTAHAGAKPAPITVVKLPQCHLNASGHKRTDSTGHAFPLDETGMPTRTAKTAAETLTIINWLEPDKTSHARYQAGGGKTFCNIYAYDFCQRMGAFLPRVWWTSKAIVSFAKGIPVPVAYASTVSELNANALHNWFEDFGPDFGWTRVFDADALQAAANAGQVAIIVARRVDLNRSGHILAVVPETATLKAALKAGKVVRPVQSQAGSVNFTAKVTATQWWLDTKFRSFGFWIHA